MDTDMASLKEILVAATETLISLVVLAAVAARFLKVVARFIRPGMRKIKSQIIRSL